MLYKMCGFNKYLNFEYYFFILGYPISFSLFFFDTKWIHLFKIKVNFLSYVRTE